MPVTRSQHQAMEDQLAALLSLMQQQREEQEKRDQVQERRYLEQKEELEKRDQIQERRYKEQKEEQEKRYKEQKEEQEKRYKEQKEEQEKRYKEQKEEQEKRDQVQERRHQQFKEELMSHLAVREQQLEERIMQSVNESVNEGLEAVNQRVLELEKKFREQLEDDTVSTESFSTANAKIKPPDYDGTTAWEIYKTQFEAAAKANGWSEPQKATSLVVALRGKAAELLQSLSAADQSNYAVLVHSLQLRFGNEHKETVFQAQLRMRQQKSGESLQEFEADIDRLIHLAYPSAPESFQTQFATERFIEGVRDSDMRYHLRLVRPRNISEALVRALEFEASRVSSSSSASVRVATCGDKKNTSMADSMATLHKAMKDMAVSMQALLERTPRSTGNRGIKCFNCGKLGHVKSNCRNRARSPSPLFRRPSGNQDRPRIQEKPIPVNVRGQLTEPDKTPRISQVNQSTQVNNLSGKSVTGRIKEQKIQTERRQGRCHGNADTLSRRPCKEDSQDCRRTEQREGHPSVRRTSVEINDGWTTKTLREEQMNDPDIGPILSAKTDDKRPEWQEIADRSPNLKALWAQWHSLKIENGLLKRAWESPDGKTVVSQLVVPGSRKSDVLQEMHDGTSGGHFGVNKTLAKIKEPFYWVNYHEDVESWCRKCEVCCATKGPRTRSRGRMVQYTVGAPFERVAIDVAGPFPQTESGNKYILVAMDYFTKWPEAYALPNQEATTVATVLVNEMFCRFGVPLELHSDQGRNFESAVFQKVMELLGIRKTRTTPLHPQSDGMVERFNRTMEHYLSKMVADHQRDWDQHLPLMLMAYRGSTHEATGYTPAKVMFGREMRLPADLMYGTPEKESLSSENFVEELKERLNNVHEQVRNKLRISSDRAKARYDLLANSRGFQDGDLVWLYNPRRKVGKSPKLSQNWEGPYTIIKKINDVVYRIQRTPRSKMKVVHLDRLARYHRTLSVRDEQT